MAEGDSEKFEQPVVRAACPRKEAHHWHEVLDQDQVLTFLVPPSAVLQVGSQKDREGTQKKALLSSSYLLLEIVEDYAVEDRF